MTTKTFIKCTKKRVDLWETECGNAIPEPKTGDMRRRVFDHQMFTFDANGLINGTRDWDGFLCEFKNTYKVDETKGVPGGGLEPTRIENALQRYKESHDEVANCETLFFKNFKAECGNVNYFSMYNHSDEEIRQGYILSVLRTKMIARRSVLVPLNELKEILNPKFSALVADLESERVIEKIFVCGMHFYTFCWVTTSDCFLKWKEGNTKSVDLHIGEFTEHLNNKHVVFGMLNETFLPREIEAVGIVLKDTCNLIKSMINNGIKYCVVSSYGDWLQMSQSIEFIPVELLKRVIISNGLVLNKGWYMLHSKTGCLQLSCGRTAFIPVDKMDAIRALWFVKYDQILKLPPIKWGALFLFNPPLLSGVLNWKADLVEWKVKNGSTQIYTVQHVTKRELD